MLEFLLLAALCGFFGSFEVALLDPGPSVRVKDLEATFKVPAIGFDETSAESALIPWLL